MEVKKILAVCGCSFMWSSKNIYDKIKGSSWPNNFNIEYNRYNFSIRKEFEERNYEHWPHFTDIYSQEKNYEVLHLAEGGESNFGIRLQIDRAIKENVDYVIIGATKSQRFEFPISEEPYFSFTPRLDQHKKQLDPLIIEAIKYGTILQNDFLNDYKSFYLLQSGLYKLNAHNIPYVFIPGPLKHLDWSDFNLIWPKDEIDPWSLNDTTDYNAKGNHLHVEKQYNFSKILHSLTVRWN